MPAAVAPALRFRRALRRGTRRHPLRARISGLQERRWRSPTAGGRASRTRYVGEQLGIRRFRRLSRGRIMDSTTTFPISFDRPSRIPMTVLGVGPNVSRVEASPSTVDVRLGWALRATIPREAVASARPLDRPSELRGPLGLSVLRGVTTGEAPLLSMAPVPDWSRSRWMGRSGCAWVRAGRVCSAQRECRGPIPGSARHSARAPVARQVRVT